MTDTPTPEAVAAALPHRGDGIEQDAFEAWAKFEHYDMTTHPLHWLFLDPKTDAARYGWAAGLAHASDRMRPIVEALAADRDAQTARADEAEAELVGAFEAAAEAVEELSKSPGTTWGQVKGHIRAMGDVGDRRAYQQMRSSLAAQTARADAAERRFANAERMLTQAETTLTAERDKVAKLVEALDSLLDAITAENKHGDRSLTITGPTANLKWLIEACEDARAIIAEVQG